MSPSRLEINGNELPDGTTVKTDPSGTQSYQVAGEPWIEVPQGRGLHREEQTWYLCPAATLQPRDQPSSPDVDEGAVTTASPSRTARQRKLPLSTDAERTRRRDAEQVWRSQVCNHCESGSKCFYSAPAKSEGDGVRCRPCHTAGFTDCNYGSLKKYTEYERLKQMRLEGGASKDVGSM